MDDHPASPHRKTSLPTFTSSIPVEIAVLPASTRTSFTRVDNNTRPGTAAGDNIDMCDEGAIPGSGGGGGGGGSSSGGGGGAPAPPAPHEGGPGPDEVVSAVEAKPAATAVVVPQIPQTLVQFLLVSGRRRSMAFVPETTVGRVKELVWNSWPNGTSATFTPSSLFPLPFLPLYNIRHEAMSPIARKGPGRPFFSRSLSPRVSFLFLSFYFFLRGGNFATLIYIYIDLLSP